MGSVLNNGQSALRWLLQRHIYPSTVVRPMRQTILENCGLRIANLSAIIACPRVCLIGCAAMVGAIIFITQPSAAQVDTLTPISKRVLDEFPDSRWEYVWLNEDDLLEWKAPPQRWDHFEVRLRTVKGDAGSADVNPGLRDALESLLNGLGDNYVEQITPSPDFRYLLIEEGRYGKGVVSWHVVPTRGNTAPKTTTIKPTLSILGAYRSAHGVWAGDSSAIAQLIDDVDYTYVIKWPVGADMPQPEAMPRRWHLVMADYGTWREFAGIEQDGGSIVIESVRYTSEDVALYDLDTAAGLRKPLKHIVHTPHQGSLQDLRLSPARDRLAWLVYVQNTRPVKGDETQQSAAEIWVSNIDGSKMKLIGSYPVGTLNPGEALIGSEYPERMRWCGDSRRLSYTLNGSLWVVPAGHEARRR